MSSKDNHKNNLKKIAYAGVLAALVFVGTELHIPTAIGHINLGDLVILVAKSGKRLIFILIFFDERSQQGRAHADNFLRPGIDDFLLKICKFLVFMAIEFFNELKILH